jgi:hypothetical protein
VAKQVSKAIDFWKHPYAQSLNPRGKLALYYALGCEYDRRDIIIEDMALATGIEMTECGDWLEQFITDSQIDRGLVMDAEL